MAREDLTLNAITTDGVVHTPVAAAADGNMFRNSGRLFLLVTNAHGSEARTLTFPTPSQIGGLDIEDPAVVVAAGTTMLIGPFRPLLFNQVSGDDIGRVYIDYNDAADLIVAMYQM
ncbi:hypothetical protein LCGC14_0662800 [marine sediment metagenome]|uniref:Uncharacterized protein n=1 Tax=marine sediment metagenome TaxID=412755 RepID=A0A0F9QT34_9ZZZZ